MSGKITFHFDDGHPSHCTDSRTLPVEKPVIARPTEALAREKCTARIIREGFDGERCLVHTRGASDGENILLTSQYLDVSGNDKFDCLQVSISRDGGESFGEFAPDRAFEPWTHDGILTAISDITPHFHKKSGKFLVTGHTVDYFIGEKKPVPPIHRRRVIPYAVFDLESGRFGKVRFLELPDRVKYLDCGSGCSQLCELESGEILLPMTFQEIKDGKKVPAKVSVLKCAFDGEHMTVLEIGNELEVANSPRGIGEASILGLGGRFYLTIRDDDHGYVSESSDGLNFTQPKIWSWDDGSIIETYNTQSHWFTLGERAYLVYTRKNGMNDHVFRHRAPLYAAEFDPTTLTLKRESEFIAVPERGARLGNFGCCRHRDSALVIASEWMQPLSCADYGSNNAVWISTIIPSSNSRMTLEST